jgi:hypothetical protein
MMLITKQRREEKVSGLLGMMEESFFRGVERKVCFSVGREGLKFFVRYMEVLVS